jgi:CheY-like chemotaxis protein
MANRKLVVVVDDDPVIVHIIEKTLGKMNAQAITISSASGALSLLHERHEEIGLVLLDLAMPGVSGYDFCRQLRAQPHLAHIPVVAVTADITATLDTRAAEAGINEVVTKPFSAETLHDVLQRYDILIG